jgi:hypothetical protein
MLCSMLRWRLTIVVLLVSMILIAGLLPPNRALATPQPEGALVIMKRIKDKIEGSFGWAGSRVTFISRKSGQQVVTKVKVNNVPLNATRNLKTEQVTHTGHNKMLVIEDKEALVALSGALDIAVGALGSKLPLQEELLVQTVGLYAEAPVGLTLSDQEESKPKITNVSLVARKPGGPVVDSCTAARVTNNAFFIATACQNVADNDGIMYFNNCKLFNFTNYHDACPSHSFVGRAEPTGPCSTDCLGRCGSGCSRSGTFGVYSVDCADHDSCCREHGGCFNPSDQDCGDEFREAADDYYWGQASCRSCQE